MFVVVVVALLPFSVLVFLFLPDTAHLLPKTYRATVDANEVRCTGYMALANCSRSFRFPRSEQFLSRVVFFFSLLLLLLLRAGLSKTGRPGGRACGRSEASARGRSAKLLAADGLAPQPDLVTRAAFF